MSFFKALSCRLALGIALGMGVAGCATLEPSSPALMAPKAKPGAAALGAGDTIRVETERPSLLAGDFTLSETGHVTLADARIVALATRHGGEAAGILAALDPGAGLVTVTLVKPAPVYVYGEVARIGYHPFAEGLTIAGVIENAGGITYRAERDRVFVSKRGSRVERPVPANSAEAVEPGDALRVPEAFF
ncbi:MAG: SLBB domain-containing protein [Pseudomonadota bacterium]